MQTSKQTQMRNNSPTYSGEIPKKKAGRAFFGVIKTVLCFLFLGISLLYAINARAMREDASGSDMLGPEILGMRIFHTRSGSMTPTILENGIIFTWSKSVENIEPGDILTFLPMAAEDTVLTHRVMEVTEQDGERSFITQGDANETADINPVTEEQVIGVAFFWVNGLDMLMTPPGLIMAGCALVIIFFVIPTLFDAILDRRRNPG